MPSSPPAFRARLTDGAVGRTLVDQAGPMLWGLLSMVFLNFLDTFFVGQLGTRELAAMSFTFPVTMVMSSVAVGLGVGASSVVARAVGQGDDEQVRRLCTDSLLLSGVLVGILIVIGHATIDPLFTALGAGPDVLPLIRRYMEIWYVAMVFLIVPMVGNGSLRAVGSAGSAGAIMVFASVINVILDPLLIFGLAGFPRLEIEGAALAALISRALSLVAALALLGGRHKMLSVRVPRLGVLLQSWRSMLIIGLPAAATQAIAPLAQGLLTRLVATHGAEAVAAWGVAMRIEAFAILSFMALATAMGPFAGQNWAARRVDRLHRAMVLSLRFCWVWGLVAWAILAVTGADLARVFNDHPVVVEQVGAYLRIVPLGYAGLGFAGVIAATLNGLGLPAAAAVLSVLRLFVLYVPLAWMGEAWLGMTGLFWGVGIANAAAGLLAWPWAHSQCRAQRRRA
ncbi:MATE family efflux transporter [Pararhodospirillum photometricum]|uniref:Multi antimicrobial extrusion protein MatE n=1 Tax=Pararhodospirillum photometricum DSM 122 TaxID=1150469 RepID=H6SNH6_PARPM|nr:MATE family efflux transporter [Pararhodospirillum photometricum]CCG09307.1 Multi antimicrobial extrusion protein MatE [Pararhodospirillum photometricum DSM 122]